MQSNYTDLRAAEIELTLDNIHSRIIGWGYYDPSPWRNYQHTHSFYEVCFVYAGEGVFRHKNQNYPIKLNDLFLARPNDLHEIQSHHKNHLGIYYWSFSLIDQNTKSSQTELSELTQSFIDGAKIILNKPSLLPQLQAFTQELKDLSIGYKFALKALAQKIILDTLRAFSYPHNIHQSHLPLPDPNDALVNEVVYFLKDNFHRTLLLRHIAAQFHLSERHINRLFKQAMGKPVMSYVKELRIERAKQLLLLPELKIGEIAFAVGIEDVRYFSTLFRQQTGLTPTQFRNGHGTVY